MSKNCLIYETLNGVKNLNVQKEGDLMKLTGVFGVCGIKNNNKRIYETANYAKMVNEMKARIKDEGGIPGELEHPQQMNITLENVSHKITDINIDENGVVTGSITLLNTPKGQIAQAIVEGGLPLFISSRATGNVDKEGHVCLERISTYDLVGTPGFSQAKLHLNENQIAESINESVYYITEKDNENETQIDMNNEEILEKLELLEDKIERLSRENKYLREELKSINIDEKLNNFADGVQKWIVEEYSPEVQNWMEDEFSSQFEQPVTEDNTEEIVDQVVEKMAPAIEKWIVEEYSPEVQKWVVEEYSPEVQNWCQNEFAPVFEKWVVDEYSPEVENWLNESYVEKIHEVVNESKNNNLDAIDETLKVLESIEVQKPKYKSKAIVNVDLDEPKYIQEMPADKRVQWDMASQEVKESIYRRAKLYNFINEDSIEKFWENVHFDAVKPTKNIYEGLETIENDRERQIRQAFRRWRTR